MPIFAKPCPFAGFEDNHDDDANNDDDADAKDDYNDDVYERINKED